MDIRSAQQKLGPMKAAAAVLLGLALTVASKAALGPHEALYSVRQHKKIGLTVRRIILNNFFRRNRKPFIFYPGIPPIFWIPFVTGLYLKFRLYGVGYPAAEKRFFVSVWVRYQDV